MFTAATFVGTFIRLGKIADGHVTRRLSAHVEAVFIEISGEVGGRGLSFTVQSHIMSLHHRRDGNVQDH